MANVSQVSSRRSFVLMGSGALLGLLLAGYSLFTARGTSTLIFAFIAIVIGGLGSFTGTALAALLVLRAAWLSRNGGYSSAEGSKSKLKAGRTAVWVTERAIQILAGYGYTREYPVERWHRDSKIYTIFEGTSEMQQLVIARAISGLRIA